MNDTQDFKLGQLTTSVETLSESIADLHSVIKDLDERLRRNEGQTLRLSIYFGILGMLAGGLGSLGMAVFLKLI